MYTQNQEKLKERILMGNANEARAKGDMEDAEDFEERRIRARDAIQMFNYIMYGQEDPPPEDDEALARGIAASDLQDV